MISIAFAAQGLLALVGVILVIFQVLELVSSILVLVPLVANISLMLVYIIMISCLGAKEKLNKTNLEKQQYVPLRVQSIHIVLNA